MRIERIPSAEERRAFYEAISARPMTDFLYARPFQRARFARIQALLSVMLPLCGDVLEIGSCEGKLTEWLVEQGVRVTAVEISGPCLERAMVRIPGKQVEWIHGDIAAVLADFVQDRRTFNLTIATSVLEHQVDPYGLMEQLRGVSDIVLASVPISEAPNENAFNVAAYSNPKRVADGTGHIWYFRPATIKALFEQVYHYEDDGISAILVGAP